MVAVEDRRFFLVRRLWGRLKTSTRAIVIGNLLGRNMYRGRKQKEN